MENEFKHIVLAGDSIFDNDVYVAKGDPGVIEQLRKAIPAHWSASKIAVDGDCVRDVKAQLENLPSNATDLVISIGGNDALGQAHLLTKVTCPADLPEVMRAPVARFRSIYGTMLDTMITLPLRATVCTIYQHMPFTDPLFSCYAPKAIMKFNAEIISAAEARGISVIRLDHICDDPSDYAKVSPIEPSVQGGAKIVNGILSALK